MITLIPETGKSLPASHTPWFSRRFWKNFHPPELIESSLPKPDIQVVFRDRCKSRPLGFVIKMTDPKILFLPG
jgi:hypothetical protein